MVEKKTPICKNCEFYYPLTLYPEYGNYCILTNSIPDPNSSCENFKLARRYVEEGYEVGEEEIKK